MILLVSYWNRARSCQFSENIQESGVISSDSSSGISDIFFLQRRSIKILQGKENR